MKALLRTPLAFLWNMLLVYLVYGLCRIVYWAENASAFEGFWTHNALRDILTGAWKFDSSAILYTNVLYAVMMLIPLHWKEGKRWQCAAKWLYVVVNGLAVVINLADAAYFPTPAGARQPRCSASFPTKATSAASSPWNCYATGISWWQEWR